MDYKRKRHWVKYRSDKCKMYLRNDFRFECAYCGIRESDHLSEIYFEKDHFISRKSLEETDLDIYDNMVYSCRKCNGTKSNQKFEMILNPCRDDIYGGDNPHIRKTGAENQYRLCAVTEEGRAFIDALQLNSRFYCRMRKSQAENEYMRMEMRSLLNEIFAGSMPGPAVKFMEYLDHMENSGVLTDEFRCGVSGAGENLYLVLKELEKRKINYQLLFDDDDLDIALEWKENTYYCEVITSDSTERYKRRPRILREKRKAWEESGKKLWGSLLLQIHGCFGIIYIS